MNETLSSAGESFALFDLVRCLSMSIDMVSPAVADHHMRVAYIASCIGEEMGLPRSDINELVIAGALHDIGAFSLKERMEALEFESAAPHIHAEKGHRLLEGLSPFQGVAALVKHHHWPWDVKGAGRVAIGSHVLNLADRVDALIDRKKEVLGQRNSVCDTIMEHADFFMPEALAAFMGISHKQSFWLDITYPTLASIVEEKVSASGSREFDLDGLERFANVISEIIDFRSSFTATHSRGVAACSEALSRAMGFTEMDCRLIRVAGHLHDLGKLAIAPGVLEKPTSLTKRERHAVVKHAYYTYRILETVRGFETINAWASFHHERLDGKGYPFRLGAAELPMGSRIVAVSDVFASLTEDRPYRKKLPEDEAMAIIRSMARSGALDPGAVAQLERNFDVIDRIKIEAQDSAYKDYRCIEDSTGQDDGA